MHYFKISCYTISIKLKGPPIIAFTYIHEKTIRIGYAIKHNTLSILTWLYYMFENPIGPYQKVFMNVVDVTLILHI